MKERDKIAHIVQGMSPNERLDMLVRTLMLSQVIEPNKLKTSLEALVKHAFAAGMETIYHDHDAAKNPEQRFQDWFNVRRGK